MSSKPDKNDKKAEEILRKAEENEQKRRKKEADKKKNGKSDKGAAHYISETAREMRESYRPGRQEVLQWCMIVLIAIGVFALFCALVDSFIATPLTYWLAGFDLGNDKFGPADIAMTVSFFLFGTASAIGIMLHQGGETGGLSDGLSGKLTGGSGTAQRNLDIITFICIVLFFLTAVAMMIAFPAGTIATS